MRLLLITREYPPYPKGGMCQIVEQMVKQHRRFGVEMTVIANHPGFGTRQEKIDGVQFYGPNTAARKYDCTEIGTKEEAREAGCVWKDTGLCEYLMQEVDASKWCYERELYENKKCAEQFACDDIQFICTETCAYASAQEAIDAWNAKHMETPFDGEDLIRSTFNLTSDMYLPGASVSECPKVLQWEIPTRVYPSPRWWCQFGDQTWTTDNPEHQENDECNEIDTNIEGFGGLYLQIV